ncbi:MAG: cbb3-type cytochrome c oxidase subunit I [candidate division NC10 bacterium]|nr:cbb3-type cytochrome c oxidase subunit I [candidate division NC10 bacterium]
MAGSKPGSGNSVPARQPSLWVPLRYFMAAQGALLATLLWAPFQVSDLLDFYYQGHALALTHLLTLGWITMTIMGASFQLVPVALETTLYSERLARWQFWIMLLGVTAMVGHFWIGRHPGMALGAGLVLVAVILHAINMGRTLWQLPRWDIVAQHVAAALTYLAATAAMGNLMALDKIFDFLGGQVLRTIHAHAHLAGIGWITMMIFGSSYKLIPMFSLGELRDERLARWQFWLLNVGLVGLFGTLLFRSAWASPFALLIAAAVGLFLWKMREVLRARRRPRLDWGLRHALSAIASLAIVTVLGLWLTTGWVPSEEFGARLAFGYGVLALLGWVSVMIIGMMYKIIPFLVWHHRYSDLVGLRPVPPATQFLGETVPRIEFWLLHIGIQTTVVGLIVASGLLVQAGTIVLALAGLAFAVALSRIYRHLVPRLTPLPEVQAVRP